jgi:hypothetical protein
MKRQRAGLYFSHDGMWKIERQYRINEKQRVWVVYARPWLGAGWNQHGVFANLNSARAYIERMEAAQDQARWEDLLS